MRMTLQIVAEALAGARVSWCLVRGGDEAMEAGHDIDVLVAPADRRRADTALRAIGLAPMPDRYGRRASFVGYDRVEDRWMRVDIADELAFGGSITVPAEAVLTRAIEDDGSRRLSPDDDFWALLTHAVLDHGHVGPEHAEALRELAAGLATTGIDAQLSGPVAAALVAKVGKSPMIESAVTIAQQREPSAMEDLAREIRQAAEATGRRDGGLRRLRRLTRRAVAVGVGARGPGVAVALIGPDGVGKTTLAKGLVGSYVRRGRRIKLGLHESGSPGSWEAVPPQLRSAARILRMVMACVDGRLARRQGLLVVWDRHPLEADVTAPIRRSNAWRFYRWIAPTPDLIVMLDAPPESIHARKAERDPATLALLRDRYHRLAASLPNVREVDASRDADAVRRHVTELIWELDRRSLAS